MKERKKYSTMSKFLAYVIVAPCMFAIASEAFVIQLQSLKHNSGTTSTRIFVVPDEPETKRRIKKNKYANFSTADKIQVDPFEALINESEQKYKELKKEIAKKENKKVELDEETLEAMKKEKRDRNKLLFPDNKSIDPYDPSTYGYTELGTIIGPHGVHGLLKIAAVTDFPERLCSPGIRHLKAPNRRSPREITLLEGRHRLKNEYLIKFEGVSERNEAVNLRGSVLYARQEERPKSIGENEYLVTELVGLEVRLVTGYGEEDIKDIDDGADLKGNLSQENKDKNIGGRFVGTIQGVVLAEEMCTIPGLGQDLLEVVLPRGRHGTASWKDELVLIPLVPSIVPTVDIERRIIYINPPGGLLDLTYVREDNVRIKGFLPETSSYEQNKYK